MKKLKQDTSQNLIWQIYLWAERHKRPLLISVLGIILFVAIGGAYLVSTLRAEWEAERLLVNADTLLKKAGSPFSVEASKFEESIKIYQGLLEAFPRTQSAERAGVSLGNLYHQLKRYDEAITTFKGSLKYNPRGSFAFLAYLGLGYAYEAKGNVEEAALAYEEGISIGSNDPLLPEGLLALARTYKALKKEDEAYRLYETVIREHSGWAESASQHLMRLKALGE